MQKEHQSIHCSLRSWRRWGETAERVREGVGALASTSSSFQGEEDGGEGGGRGRRDRVL